MPKTSSTDKSAMDPVSFSRTTGVMLPYRTRRDHGKLVGGAAAYREHADRAIYGAKEGDVVALPDGRYGHVVFADISPFENERHILVKPLDGSRKCRFKDEKIHELRFVGTQEEIDAIMKTL